MVPQITLTSTTTKKKNLKRKSQQGLLNGHVTSCNVIYIYLYISHHI